MEFSASFRANEVNAILDIATPELTSAVTRYLTRRAGTEELRTLGDVVDHTEIVRRREISELEASDRAELASAVTMAIRADFRGDSTKEFYAKIGEDENSFTAVTVCEGNISPPKTPIDCSTELSRCLRKSSRRLTSIGPSWDATSCYIEST
ncbi:hypothetical protein GS539_17155 [Rhodococcus hoagii]|nr:hypothetical protein [Prescottella equi]